MILNKEQNVMNTQLVIIVHVVEEKESHVLRDVLSVAARTFSDLLGK